jgi:transposase
VKKLQPDIATAEKPLAESERAELQRLRTQNAKLEMQLDFAKKVSTWFAKGQQ